MWRRVRSRKAAEVTLVMSARFEGHVGVRERGFTQSSLFQAGIVLGDPAHTEEAERTVLRHYRPASLIHMA